MSFTRVTKQQPCPVCKKPDWCRVFGDGWVECMRVQSDKPAKSGGWMHRQCLLPPLPRPQRRPSCPQPPQINARKLMREWSVDTTTATAVRATHGEQAELDGRRRVRRPFADEQGRARSPLRAVLRNPRSALRTDKDALSAATHRELAALVAQPDADNVAVAVTHRERPRRVRRRPGRSHRPDGRS